MELAPCNGVMNATKLPRNKQMLAKQRDACFMERLKVLLGGMGKTFSGAARLAPNQTRW